MLKALLLISLLIQSFILQINSKEHKPDFVVVLGRHGTCEPSSSSYDDLWKSPSYLGDVGIEQQYTLGNLLAKQYQHLIRKISPSEIYIQEADSKCARMSLSAELLGLFHEQSHKHIPSLAKKDFHIPFENQTLVEGVTDELSSDSISIPNRLQFLTQKFVSTNEAPEGNAFQANPNTCIILKRGLQKRYDSAPNRKMALELIETIKGVKRLDYNVNDFHQLKQLGDDLLSRYNAGEPSLKGISYESTLFEDSAFALRWWNLYNLVGSGTEKAVQIFPFYHYMSKWFKEKADGKLNLKLVLLNGYDHSLFVLLNEYKIATPECFYENYHSKKDGKPLPHPTCEYPEVGSQLIYEFYNTENPYIRLLYNGNPIKFCKHSKGVECPLEDFLKEVPEVLQGLTEEKHDELCGLPKKPKKKSKVGMIIATCILGLIVLMTVYLLLSKKIRIRNKSELETRAILAGTRESGINLVRADSEQI